LWVLLLHFVLSFRSAAEESASPPLHHGNLYLL